MSFHLILQSEKHRNLNGYFSDRAKFYKFKTVKYLRPQISGIKDEVKEEDTKIIKKYEILIFQSFKIK